MTAPRTRSRVVARWILVATAGATILAPAVGAQPLGPVAPAHALGVPLSGPAELRHRMLGFINRSRTSRGLEPLRIDRRLSAEALGHSRKMARESRIFHTPGLAAIVAGEGGTVFGENLARGRGLRGIRDAWLRRTDTRRILLDPRFRRAGLGVLHRDGFYWVTLQAFD